LAAAFAAAAEFPYGAGEELRAGTYHEQRRCARQRRRCQERSRRVVSGEPRRSDSAVQPWIAAIDHLAGEYAAAAYGTPATLARVIPVVLMLPRQTQPHAPRLLALAQSIVALRSVKKERQLSGHDK